MDEEERYTISELADEASVSVRTVRYYIAEGLLPPAVTHGARSYYTRDHLDRLRLIGRMKEGFLPLREIRKQLVELDDEAIRRFAADEILESSELYDRETPAPDALRLIAPVSQPATAQGFIYGREDIRSSRPEPTLRDSATEYIARVLRTSGPRGVARSTRASMQAPILTEPDLAAEPQSEPSAQAPADTLTWRRIAIADGAELLIREDAYHRRSDKIEWLVDWARKVLN